MTYWQNFVSEFIVKICDFESLKVAFKKIYILLQSKISRTFNLIQMMKMVLLKVEK
jgi:hypothetical protein